MGASAEAGVRRPRPHSVVSMRDITRRAPRTGMPDVVRRRSQASHEVQVSIAPRCSARVLAGSASSSGGEGGLQVLPEQGVGGGHRPPHGGRRRCPADEGTPDLGGLLEERGPVRDRPFDPGRQREPRGQLGHVGPLAAELQGGDELVQVVHVGEVVEHEAERHAGPPGHRLRRGVRVAGAEQLHQGLGDVRAGSAVPGPPSVPGRFLERDHSRPGRAHPVPGSESWAGRGRDRLPPRPLRRPLPRRLPSLESTFLSV